MSRFGRHRARFRETLALKKDGYASLFPARAVAGHFVKMIHNGIEVRAWNAVVPEWFGDHGNPLGKTTRDAPDLRHLAARALGPSQLLLGACSTRPSSSHVPPILERHRAPTWKESGP